MELPSYLRAPHHRHVINFLTITNFFLVYFCCAAHDRVYGILLLELKERFPEASMASLAALGGSVTALTFMFGPVTTLLLNVGVTPRQCIIACGFLAAAGALVSAYVSKLWILFITYVIPLGVGLGLAFTAIFVVISRRFSDHLPLAMGFAYTGYMIGGFILTPIIVVTLRELSYTGTMWIISGIMLQMIVAGMAAIPQTTKAGGERGKKERLGSLLDLTLLKDPVFMLIAISFAITTPCTYGIYTYLPSFVKEVGMKEETASHLMMICHVSAAVAPPLCGALTSIGAVRPHIPSIAVAVCVFNAIVEAFFYFSIAHQGFIGLSIFTVLNGFLGGVWVLLRPLYIHQMRGQVVQTVVKNGNQGLDSRILARSDDRDDVDRDQNGETGDNLASLFGIFNCIVGIGTVAVPATSGSLVDASKSTKVAFLFHACGHVLGVIALTLAMFLSRLERRSAKGGV